MIRRIKADIRTLEWTDALELFLVAGTMLSFGLLAIIWSGNLPA